VYQFLLISNFGVRKFGASESVGIRKSKVQKVWASESVHSTKFGQYKVLAECTTVSFSMTNLFQDIKYFRHEKVWTSQRVCMTSLGIIKFTYQKVCASASVHFRKCVQLKVRHIRKWSVPKKWATEIVRSTKFGHHGVCASKSVGLQEVSAQCRLCRRTGAAIREVQRVQGKFKTTREVQNLQGKVKEHNSQISNRRQKWQNRRHVYIAGWAPTQCILCRRTGAATREVQRVQGKFKTTREVQNLQGKVKEHNSQGNAGSS
jgi:hypothetical protein